MKFTKFLWLFLSIILASTVLLTACGDISKKDSESTELISKDQEISGEDGGISWSLKNGVLTFSGKGKMTDYKYDSKPWKAYIVSIKKVVIEDGIESIGNDAFSYCVNLKDVSIPDSVTSIGKMAFENCESLGSITIPDSVTTIGESAFCFCLSLKDITIPDSVTSIGKMAFENCESLGSITIPDSVTTIGESAFCFCLSLKDITIPDSVTSIGDLAFQNCDSLKGISVSKNNKNYCDVDGVLFDKSVTELVQYPCGKASESYVIPDSVTSIAKFAFSGCDILKDIYFNGPIPRWNAFGFNECKIPDSITVHCTDGDI